MLIALHQSDRQVLPVMQNIKRQLYQEHIQDDDVARDSVCEDEHFDDHDPFSNSILTNKPNCTSLVLISRH